MKSFYSLLGILWLLGCTTVDSSKLEDQQSSASDESVADRVWTVVETENEPLARHENAFVELNGNFFLIGGRNNKPINIYDPNTNTWTEGETPPLEMHHFQALAFDDKIYVLGAFTGKFPHETPIPDVYTYTPTTDQWDTVATIPEDRRRGAAGASVYQGKIYVVGGIQDGHYDGHVTWFDEFDPANKSWTKLPDAPRPRDHFQSAIMDNKLFVAGGRNTSAKTEQTMELTIPEVDVFDFSANQWYSLENPLPTERAGTTSVVIGNQLFVIGGESGSQVPGHDEVEVWNAATNRWEKVPSLIQGRHGTQADVFQGKIYIAAGSGNRGGGPELTSLETIQVKKVEE